jgi:lipid A ethanolaminephosphotransferase
MAFVLPEPRAQHDILEGAASGGVEPPRARTAAKHRTLPTFWGLLAAPLVIVAVALFIVAFDNLPLWDTVARDTALDEHRLAIFWSLFAIVFFTLTSALSLVPGTRTLKAVAAVLLLIAATTGFFMSEYGIVIDQSMIRNIVETETREAAPLFGVAFFEHLFFYGVVPAVGLFFVPLRAVPLRHALLVRLGVTALGIGTMATSVYANFGAISFFGHQHHDVRMLMNPGYPLFAAARFAFRGEDKPTVREPLDARLAAGFAPARKPALLIFVMGETARADRFSFNGYERDTNRYAAARRRELPERHVLWHFHSRFRAVRLLPSRPAAVHARECGAARKRARHVGQARRRRRLARQQHGLQRRV